MPRGMRGNNGQAIDPEYETMYGRGRGRGAGRGMGMGRPGVFDDDIDDPTDARKDNMRVQMLQTQEKMAAQIDEMYQMLQMIVQVIGQQTEQGAPTEEPGMPTPMG